MKWTKIQNKHYEAGAFNISDLDTKQKNTDANIKM